MHSAIHRCKLTNFIYTILWRDAGSETVVVMGNEHSAPEFKSQSTNTLRIGMNHFISRNVNMGLQWTLLHKH